MNGVATVGSLWKRVGRRAVALQDRLPLLQIVAVVFVYLVCVATIAGYGGRSSLASLLVLASFTGIASAGQTLAALIGGLDLSIPAVLGGANVAISQLTGAAGWSFVPAAAAVLAGAGLLGGLNGYLSQRFRIHSLLVTIGTGAVVGGLISAWTGGQSTAAAPTWLGTITSPRASTGFIPVPPVVLMWAVVALIMIFVLRRTAYGRYLYATGSNQRAADYTLINTTAIWAVTFALSAICAAITGILLAGFTGAGLLSVGDPYLFTTIACVVVGGTSLLGGRGDYTRTILGALLLTELTVLFVGFGLSAPAQQVVLGLLIIVVVAVYGREGHVRGRV